MKRKLQSMENEGSSGDVDENKEGQVSGVRFQVSGAGSPSGCRTPPIPAGGIPDKLNEAAHRNSSKMKVHPGMLMKTNKGRFQVSGARCQGAAPTGGCRTHGTASIPAGGIPDKLSEAAHRNSSIMKVHPGMLMKKKKDRLQVLGARCRGRVSIIAYGTLGTPSRIGCVKCGHNARKRAAVVHRK
jgi:hypothetical protein